MGSAAYTANVERVIARIYGDGRIDTSLVVSDAYPPPCVFTSVVRVHAEHPHKSLTHQIAPSFCRSPLMEPRISGWQGTFTKPTP